MTQPERSEELLSAYVDGELDAETRSEVEARLAASADWRAVLDDVRAARDAVRGLPAVDLSPDAWSQVIAAVTAADPAVRPATTPRLMTARHRRGHRRHARWVAVGAAAAAAAAVAVAIVPGPKRVTPNVATFATEHSTRASLASDPVSTLAGVSVMRGMGR
jgi:anti-sigma factor RsiW